MPKNMMKARKESELRQGVRHLLKEAEKTYRWHIRQWKAAEKTGENGEIVLHRSVCANMLDLLAGMRDLLEE